MAELGLGASDAVSEQPGPERAWSMITPPKPTRADVKAGRISQAHFIAAHGYPWTACDKTPTEEEEIVLIREWEIKQETRNTKWLEDLHKLRKDYSSLNANPSGAVSKKLEPKPWYMVTPPEPDREWSATTTPEPDLGRAQAHGFRTPKPTRADVQAGRISQAHFRDAHGYDWDVIGKTPTEEEAIVLVREQEIRDKEWWDNLKKRNEEFLRKNPSGLNNDNPPSAVSEQPEPKPPVLVLPPKPTRADVQAGRSSPDAFVLAHGYPWDAMDRTPTEEEAIVLIREWEAEEEMCEKRWLDKINRRKYEDFLRRHPSLAREDPSGAGENTPAEQDVKSRTLSEESQSERMTPMAGCMETQSRTTPVQHCPSPGTGIVLPLSTPGGQTPMGVCTTTTNGTENKKRKRSLSLGSQEAGINTPLSSVTEQHSDWSTSAKKRKM